MDSCIVLRTAVVKDGTMHVQAGAGIVADSDPAYEQRECQAKAGALLAAAREAIARASEPDFGQQRPHRNATPVRPELVERPSSFSFSRAERKNGASRSEERRGGKECVSSS